MKSLLDPAFRYTPSVSTDLRKTFARIRRENAKQQTQAHETAQVQAKGDAQVVQIHRKEQS